MIVPKSCAGSGFSLDYRTAACELVSTFYSAVVAGAESRTMRIDQELDFLLREGLALASEAVKQPARRRERRERSKNWKKRLRVVRKAIQKKFGGRI